MPPAVPVPANLRPPGIQQRAHRPRGGRANAAPVNLPPPVGAGILAQMGQMFPAGFGGLGNPVVPFPPGGPLPLGFGLFNPAAPQQFGPPAPALGPGNMPNPQHQGQFRFQ